MVSTIWQALMRLLGVKGNRRDFDRTPVDTGAILRIGGQAHACQLVDVSVSGAFITPVVEATVGGYAVLEVPQALIRADVRIVRRTDSGLALEYQADGVGAIIAGWSRGQSRAPDEPDQA